MPFLRVFITLCWETAWVGKSDIWLQKLPNQQGTIAEIEALFNVLSERVREYHYLRQTQLKYIAL